jgi:hypothetical protein
VAEFASRGHCTGKNRCHEQEPLPLRRGRYVVFSSEFLRR